jgi:hypothetical protein
MGQASAAEYLVADRATNRILRYDAANGNAIGALVDDNLATNGGLFLPTAMAYGFGGDLFVTSINLTTGSGEILRYDAATGAFKETFASGLVGPAGLLYHQRSNTMLVGSLGTGLGDSNVITRLAADGESPGNIELGPISGRTGMIARPDGTVYASSFAEEPFFNGSVLQYDYDATSDSFSLGGVFAAAPELLGANGLMADDADDLLVASLLGQSVIRFDVQGGAPIGSSVFANTAYPSDVILGPDNTVLVTSLGNNNPNDPIYTELFPGAVFKFDATTGAMIGTGPFLVGGEEFLPAAILARGVPGDFDGDGRLREVDINWLSSEARVGTHATSFDLNGDGLVDDSDRAVWVHDLKQTTFGDANLDGAFNSTDLVEVLAAGEYEDDVAGNSRWGTGDWNGNGDFQTSDLILAMQEGSYEVEPAAAVASVPEPATISLLAGIISLAGWWQRQRRGRVGEGGGCRGD